MCLNDVRLQVAGKNCAVWSGFHRPHETSRNICNSANVSVELTEEQVKASIRSRRLHNHQLVDSINFACWHRGTSDITNPHQKQSKVSALFTIIKQEEVFYGNALQTPRRKASSSTSWQVNCTNLDNLAHPVWSRWHFFTAITQSGTQLLED